MAFNTLITCIFVTLAALFLGGAPAAAERDGIAGLPGPVFATVDRVIDGDTVEVTARIWLDLEIAAAVRLAHVDTPEITGARCPAERRLGEAARDFVRQRLEGRIVRLTDIERGKYARRVVARIETVDGGDLGDALIAARLARDYGDRKSWCA
ncbi:MAG: thermonuclease family protein [Pseudomonadota bacterium]